MYAYHKSLNFGQYVPNDKVLNKKVPDNPKYRHVRPAVDTGKNVKRHIDELKEKLKGGSYKKDEGFNRIKFSTFIRLATSIAKDLKPDQVNDFKAEDRRNSNDTKNVDKSGFANVLVGIGEIDLRNEKKKPLSVIPKVEKQVPYLLLDVRDKDRFLQNHIKTAKHYPAAMLSRSIGYEIEEMKLYKNNHPEIIILYDDDESIVSRVATTLIQRGYENIYVLSGGLNLGYEVFPRSLMASITTAHNSLQRPGSNSCVQIKISSPEYFSKEDIDNIQQYMQDCPHKGKSSVGTKSYTTYSKSDKVSSNYQKSREMPATSSNHGSATYRRNSACSTRSIEQARTTTRAGSRCTTEEKFKPTKKAPRK